MPPSPPSASDPALSRVSAVRRPRFCARLLAAGVVMGVLGGCKLVDQRTFDPNAGRPPVPHVPHHPGPKPIAPFLVVRAGTPEAEWRPVVTHAAQVALARKPGVLFVLTGLAPDHATPADQVRALGAVASGDERAVADAIIAAGAPPLQVQMQVRTDPGGMTRVQVDVR